MLKLNLGVDRGKTSAKEREPKVDVLDDTVLSTRRVTREEYQRRSKEPEF